MKNISKIAATLIAGVALSTSVANAATSNGSVNATVEIIPALTITETNTLDFGKMVSGSGATVSYPAPASCDFATNTATNLLGAAQITNASAGQAVTVDILFNDLDDGAGDLIPITGNATYCDADAGTATDVTPAASPVTLVADGANNENTIYLGGDVTEAGQPVGVYNSTVDITLTY